MFNKIFQYTLITVALSTTSSMFVSCSNNSSAKTRPNIVTKDAAPRPGVVAKIGDKEITSDQLFGEAYSKFYEIWMQEYQLRMDRVKELMTQQLLGEAAQKAGMKVEEFIAKNVTKGEIKITSQEFENFIKERNVPKDKLNDELKKRIETFLSEDKKTKLVQNYVAELTKKNPVEVYFKKPKPLNVEVGNAPFAGGESASVNVVVFSDFQCPFCSRAADVVTQIKKKYGSKIKLAFKHFPLTQIHPNAKAASEASMCVHEQNKDKFWKFHDLAFKNQQKLDAKDLETYAKDSGADVTKFKECVASKKYEGHVLQDLAYGEKIGVRSTPTFFVNGQMVSGAQPIDVFSEIIDEELASAKN